MSEPVTTGGATVALTGVTFVGLLSGVDAGVVIGAFAGAVVFIMSAPDFTLVRRVTLFGASFFAGLLSSDFFAAMITAYTPEKVTAGKPLGALIASAIAVRLLMFISNGAKDPISLLERLKGRGKDE